MAPPFPESKITLDYPLRGCDFDPQDSNRLFVGGGGGEGHSGVGNKITLLDASSQDKLDAAGEVSLSRNEDNVTTLIAGQRKGKSTLLYAGINSSSEDMQRGKNEHFRVFGAEQPSKAKSILGPNISELARASIFTTKSTDTYQRLLRLSQAFPGSPQLGAVATGFAKEAQIALFDVAAGNSVAPKARGILDIPKEAVDLDIIQTADDEYQLIYCNDYDIYTLHFSKNSSSAEMEPMRVYTMPSDDSSGLRPALRCIRYLTPRFAIGVANIPKSGGIVLYGYRLPKTNTGNEGTEARARIAVNAKLPRRAGAKATGLAVANLSPVASPGAKQGDAQFVVAVASNDFSIHLYTLNHSVVKDVDLLANLYPLTQLKNVHEYPISSLCFSHFIPPTSGTGRVQYLKLASASISNTVVVQSIPLKKFIDPSSPVRRGGPPRQPRYVVAMESRAPSVRGLAIGVAVLMVVIGVLLQGLLEVKGLAPPVVGGHKFLPTSWHSVPATPVPPHAGFLARLLEENEDLARKDTGKIVLLGSDISPGDVRVEEYEEAAHGPARAWDDLEPHQRDAWKERLKNGRHWTADVGETIFKGMLFGELAGVAAGVVGG